MSCLHVLTHLKLETSHLMNSTLPLSVWPRMAETALQVNPQINTELDAIKVGRGCEIDTEAHLAIPRTFRLSVRFFR